MSWLTAITVGVVNGAMGGGVVQSNTNSQDSKASVLAEQAGVKPRGPGVTIETKIHIPAPPKTPYDGIPIPGRPGTVLADK